MSILEMGPAHRAAVTSIIPKLLELPDVFGAIVLPNLQWPRLGPLFWIAVVVDGQRARDFQWSLQHPQFVFAQSNDTLVALGCLGLPAALEQVRTELGGDSQSWRLLEEGIFGVALIPESWVPWVRRVNTGPPELREDPRFWTYPDVQKFWVFDKQSGRLIPE